MDAASARKRLDEIEHDLPSLLPTAFPRWTVWQDGREWHARRRGNFRALHEPGAPVYAVHSADLRVLWARLAVQDAMSPPDGWDDDVEGRAPRRVHGGVRPGTSTAPPMN